MNRADRRKAKVPKGVTPVDLAILKKQAIDEIMAKIDVDKMKQDAAEEAARVGFTLMMCIPALVARDKFGFGKKRLTTLVEGCMETYDAYEKGYITLDDLTETLKEETGYEFE